MNSGGTPAAQGPTIARLIAHARHQLIGVGFSRADAALDAEVLARHILGWDRARLLTDGRLPPPADFEGRYHAAIERRLSHEPVAMITGHREFWELDFLVTPATLIPRPETEVIVEEALRIVDARAPSTIVDIGTGTGCLAVALARERRSASVVATDASRAALLIAMKNAERHGVAERVWFVQTDLADGLGVRADLIVSNPPYVPDGTALPADVVGYEPRTAIFGGGDGLAVIRRLFASTRHIVAPGGRLIVEFGFGQEHAIRDIGERAGWHVERVLPDLQGIARTIVLGR